VYDCWRPVAGAARGCRLHLCPTCTRAPHSPPLISPRDRRHDTCNILRWRWRHRVTVSRNAETTWSQYRSIIPPLRCRGEHCCAVPIKCHCSMYPVWRSARYLYCLWMWIGGETCWSFKAWWSDNPSYFSAPVVSCSRNMLFLKLVELCTCTQCPFHRMKLCNQMTSTWTIFCAVFV